ncbi:MAG TPA: helix-turn-helix domain-containing protein [Armatimonadota bacterium]
MSTCITIPMTDPLRRCLDVISHSPTCEHRLVLRARILLACATDPCNEAVAQTCNTNRETVRKWRRRWLDAQDTLAAAEAGDEGAPSLRHMLETLLIDTRRGGRPPTFTPEQITQLIALACTKPTDVGREGTHWTPRELADELQRQGIVAHISPRHVGRFLKGSRPAAASQPVLA